MSNHPLQKFIPFQHLSDTELMVLGGQVRTRRCRKGEVLFNHGEIDANEFFIVSGSVELVSGDNRKRVIRATDEVCKRQIAKLRPRQYTCVAREEAEIVVVDSDLLDSIESGNQRNGADAMAYGVQEISEFDAPGADRLSAEFFSLIDHDKLVVPSLPEVALRVRKLLAEDDTTADDIAKVVNTDPAIAAKILRAANSPIYRGASSCDTTRNAVVRLGMETTRQLVMSFAAQELFKSKNPRLKKRMLQVWQHSVEVAAVSHVVATMSNQVMFSAEEAMLGGLLHDIGYIATIGFIENHEELIEDPERLKEFSAMKSRAGEHVLSCWQFPKDFIEMAALGEDWKRDHSGAADLCDVIQVAKLQCYYGYKDKTKLPKIDKIPAYAKLALGDLSPELTVAILDGAKQEISEVKSLLGI